MTTSASEDSARRSARLARSAIASDVEAHEITPVASEQVVGTGAAPVSSTHTEQAAGAVAKRTVGFQVRRIARRAVAWRRRLARRRLGASNLQSVMERLAAVEHGIWLQLNHLDHKIDTSDHQRWLDTNHLSTELRALGRLDWSMHNMSKDLEALSEMVKELLLQVQVAQRSTTIGTETLATALQQLGSRLDAVESWAAVTPKIDGDRGAKE